MSRPREKRVDRSDFRLEVRDRRHNQRNSASRHSRPLLEVVELRRLVISVRGLHPLLCALPLLGLVAVLLVSPAAVAQQWLVEANQRIEQYRKGDLTVRVVDPLGQAVEGANVQVSMQRHAFGFGTAVTAELISRVDTTGDTYREKLLENFNTVVFENDLKWPAWAGLWGGGFNWSNTEQALDWLDANNLPARGHYMSWATWSGSDAWGTSSDIATLSTRLLDHITDKATTVGSRVIEWDVINHPVGWGLPTYEDHFGIDFYKEIIDHARSVAPAGMPMWINEDSITTGGLSDDYERIIRYLIENDSPPDGIGIQGHINESWGRIRTPEQVYSELDRMANVIPRLKITEFDVNTPGNDDYQGQLLHDYLVTFFSHPAMEEVLLWGFWGGRHWLGDDGALYREDWTEKPAIAAYQDLVFNQWWTEEDGVTDSLGEFDARGFLGDYEVVIDYDGARMVVPLNFETGSDVLTVVMTKRGDFDVDGDVDGDDFLVWQASFGVDAGGDADDDGDSDGDDFLIWQAEFGSGSGSASAAVPEPSSWLMTAVGLALFLTKRTRPHTVHMA